MMHCTLCGKQAEPIYYVDARLGRVAPVEHHLPFHVGDNVISAAKALIHSELSWKALGPYDLLLLACESCKNDIQAPVEVEA